MKLILGTAKFGGQTCRQNAIRIIAKFLEFGGRSFDTAVNYPMSGDPSDLRLSLNILAEAFRVLSVRGAEVIVKIGATTNDGSESINLSPAYMKEELERLEELFPGHKIVISPHWDNRDDPEEIKATADCLVEMRKSISGVGLSGIRHPGLYAERFGEYSSRVLYQVRFSALDEASILEVARKYGDAQYVAYGIAGGPQRRRLSAVEFQELALMVRERHNVGNAHCGSSETLFHIGMQLLAKNSLVRGVIVGPSTTQQVENIFSAFSALTDSGR